MSFASKSIALALGCALAGIAAVTSCAQGAVAVDPLDDGGSTADAIPPDPNCPDADLNSDPAHCGTCKTVCPGSQVCVSGACKPECASPMIKCAGVMGCVDITSDPKHCGGCATACTLTDAGDLAPGTGNPDDSGVPMDGGMSTGWDLGMTACVKSACTVTCANGRQNCGGICWDVQNAHDHCGDCNTACAVDEWCGQGHCCATGTEYCGGMCVDVMTDTNNCGGCGITCMNNLTCGGGKCVACSPFAGPALPNNIGGWPTAGLRIKALKNTTITSFVFNNQGAADTVNLTNTAGNVLQTIATPAATPAYTANVSWSLTAGTSYDLVSVNGSNGKWGNYSSYPSVNPSASLEFDAMVNNTQTLSTIYWFSFTGVMTCP